MGEEESGDLRSEEPPTRVLLPSFLAVKCTTTGTERRFADGTAAGFAVSLMNKRLGTGSPFALCIEAAKAGEEPIVFGPNAVLVDYGNGWKLQTVTDLGHTGGHTSGGSHSTRTKVTANQAVSLVYIGKIVLAFVFIFVMGAFFTLALEYLPLLIKALSTFM